MGTHQAQRTARRKLQAAARRFAAHNPRGAARYLPPAFFMTDRPDRTPDILGVAGQLPIGWGVIYRHFGDSGRAEIARRLADIARRRGLCLLIAADPDLARSVHAHGVHWPNRLLPQRASRRRFGLETASAHNARERHRAVRAGVEALLASTIFASESPSAGPPLGPQRFLRMAATTPLPLYALGGVNQANAARLASGHTNAPAGFAAVSSIHDVWKSRPIRPGAN